MSASVYEHIKHRIVHGTLPPGTALVERTIADQLGVSRVPVREAFQRLTFEGLLVNADGLRTRTYNEQEMLDIYVYREALDGMSTRLFTVRANELEVQYVQMVLKEMEGAVDEYDADYWEEKDIEFHHAIARGARNERLYRAIGHLYDECFYILRTYRGGPNARKCGERPRHLQDVYGEHERIVQAILSSDPESAEAAARASVRRATERMMRVFVERKRTSGGSSTSDTVGGTSS